MSATYENSVSLREVAGGFKQTVRLLLAAPFKNLLYGLIFSLLVEFLATSAPDAGAAPRSFLVFFAFAPFTLFWAAQFGARRSEYGLRSFSGALYWTLALYILLFLSAALSFFLIGMPTMIALKVGSAELELLKIVPFIFTILFSLWVLSRLWPLLAIVHIYSGENRYFFAQWYWSSPNFKEALALTSGREALLFASLPAVIYFIAASIPLIFAQDMGISFGPRIALSAFLFPLVTGLIYERALRLARARKVPDFQHQFFSESFDIIQYALSPTAPRSKKRSLREWTEFLENSDSVIFDAPRCMIDGKFIGFDYLMPIIRTRITDFCPPAAGNAREIAEHFVVAVHPYEPWPGGLSLEMSERVAQRTRKWMESNRIFRLAHYQKNSSDDVTERILKDPAMILEAAAGLVTGRDKDIFHSKNELISLFQFLSRKEFYLLPVEQLNASQHPKRKFDHELLNVSHRYWNAAEYGALLSATDPAFEALAAFSSLMYAGEPELSRGGEPGVPWEEAAEKFGEGILEPTLFYLSNTHTLEKRWDFQGGLYPPAKLAKLAQYWSPEPRARFFSIMIEAGFINILQRLAPADWINRLKEQYDSTPYGEVKTPLVGD